MPKIIQLEQHVANLIAAGEVVSRPASVVKELVENAIDSGAGSITAEITSGGMVSIRITDNGCGIAPEDVKTAFLRHATSKLSDADGLSSIETLGFRGEALAAIAAVSRVEILTRTSENLEGTMLKLEGGTPVDEGPAGSPSGTAITVRNLFFNTPARQKFMKTDRAEGAAVTAVMQSLALSRPDISFRYIKDGKTEFHTPGDNDIKSCVYTVLGREFEAGLIPLTRTADGVSVSGYVCKADASRGNRSYQYFFLNGRVIQSSLLRAALEQAYRNKLMTGRFPSCVLYVETSASAVDVNVHPAKTEVKFVSDKQIFDCVYYAVLSTLEKPGQEREHNETAQSEAAQHHRHHHDKYPHRHTGSTYRQMSVSELSPQYTAMRGISNTSKPPVTEHRQNISAPAVTQDASHEEQPCAYRIIGEALCTYIIVECDDSIRFIDKHAAHERIQYNILTSGTYEPMTEALLSPVVCRVGASNAALLAENATALDSLGFTVDSFGEDTVAIRSIPCTIRQSDAEPLLSEIAEELGRGNGLQKDGSMDKLYKSIACKAAIKAGSISDVCELETLTARVMAGEITHCPHGRPVVFEMTKQTLEKSFGRA